MQFARATEKTHKPIASVAALTAQPLAALPPYGCGVPLAGSERLWQLQVSRHFRRAYRLSSLSLRGGRRPTWRPEREARGSALGVQSREGSCSSYKLSLKWCAPIASVAALTAQPLAALPPYGCGVPLAGCERLAGWQSLRHAFCGARPSSLSLRGPKGAVAISGRQFRFRRWLSCDPAMTCEIAPQGHFLALRAQGATSACGLLAMTNLGPVPF